MLRSQDKVSLCEHLSFDISNDPDSFKEISSYYVNVNKMHVQSNGLKVCIKKTHQLQLNFTIFQEILRIHEASIRVDSENECAHLLL